ncbi:hypothetical protein BLOT_005627 [Blomia tropicalis]|nr:hypothetical protein BLOT_005627 [Blomia tropicalis]
MKINKIWRSNLNLNDGGHVSSAECLSQSISPQFVSHKSGVITWISRQQRQTERYSNEASHVGTMD